MPYRSGSAPYKKRSYSTWVNPLSCVLADFSTLFHTFQLFKTLTTVTFHPPVHQCGKHRSQVRDGHRECCTLWVERERQQLQTPQNWERKFSFSLKQASSLCSGVPCYTVVVLRMKRLFKTLQELENEAAKGPATVVSHYTCLSFADTRLHTNR